MSGRLDGRTVVVTRPAHQAGELIERAREHGASVIALPLTAVVAVQDSPEIDAAVAGLGGYAAVVVTSANGAACFVEQLRRRAARLPGDVAVAAVGAVTARALEDAGVRVTVVPQRATGAALADALEGRGIDGRRVLLARARAGRPELADGLRSAGAIVDDVAFYDTVALTPDAALVDAVFADPPSTAFVLTAPSGVRGLADAAGADRVRSVRAVVIGATTADAARAAGMEVVAVAAEQTVDGLVEALLEAWG